MASFSVKCSKEVPGPGWTTIWASSIAGGTVLMTAATTGEALTFITGGVTEGGCTERGGTDTAGG